MLAELEEIVPIDDPHLGHHLGVWRPLPLAWAACEDPPELTTLLDLKADEPGYFFCERHRDAWWQPLRKLIWARFEAQALERAAVNPLFVVKEPGSHVAPLLTELFPASKLIFLLRDGRDVVDSWLDAYSEGSWAIPGGAFAVASEGRLPLIRWLSAVWAYRSRAVRAAFENRPPEDRILIRYEDLLGETERCLKRTCTMLSLSPGRLTDVVARYQFERMPGADRGCGQAVRRATPGGWLENLTAEEQAAMHEVLGPALREFGYGEEPVKTLVGAG